MGAFFSKVIKEITMSKINTIKLEKRGRPKGVKNGIEHLTVQQIIDKLGADCKLKIPISKKWWDNLI